MFCILCFSLSSCIIGSLSNTVWQFLSVNGGKPQIPKSFSPKILLGGVLPKIFFNLIECKTPFVALWMKFFSGQISVLSTKIVPKGGALRRTKSAKQYLTGSQYIYHLKKDGNHVGFLSNFHSTKQTDFL